MKTAHVYFMANKNNTTIYVGVSSYLVKRVYQHKNKIYKGFTSRYNCDKLVYFEAYDSIVEAIAREKQIKKGNRKNKEKLIATMNPEWNDLSDGWLFNFDS
ncbi:GIY-YIG nuclease family protein [Lacinutrix neustonica]|uniref:GIY-YIG nuclease family protein n=1 Tax=Lacinutrix neustonica TaxID=2980107 RepID=A0A9E8SDZ5_9FLAO|nr:GIY-YIG nuclease family protein [Lacinutrix neustonica]WAC02267.1 GIY-YIG nuclease family protein [Lacinutrix neustonica]